MLILKLTDLGRHILKKRRAELLDSWEELGIPERFHRTSAGLKRRQDTTHKTCHSGAYFGFNKSPQTLDGRPKLIIPELLHRIGPRLKCRQDTLNECFHSRPDLNL